VNSGGCTIPQEEATVISKQLFIQINQVIAAKESTAPQQHKIQRQAV